MPSACLPEQQVPSPLEVLGNVKRLVLNAAEYVLHFQLQSADCKSPAEAAHVFIHVTQLTGHAGPPSDSSLSQSALTQLQTSSQCYMAL